MLDISIWGRSERAFVDVRVFNPFSYSIKCCQFDSLSACYKKHENIKKTVYGQRIQEIKCVSSATGGLAHETTYFYKRLASLLSHRGK